MIHQQIIGAVATVIKSLFVLFLVTWRKGAANILINTITNDGMFGAVDVLLESLLKRQATHTCEADFKSRYLYYTLVSLGCFIIHLLTWFRLTLPIYWIVMFTTIPCVLNYILHTRVWIQLYNLLIEPLTRLCRYILCSTAAYIINVISETCFDKHPGVSQSEIATTIQNKDASHLIVFVKVFAITNVMHYLERRNIYYAGAFRMLYTYGKLMDIKSNSAVSDPYPAITDPKEKILKVLLHRQWNYFTNPDVLKLVLRIYEDSPKGKIFQSVTRAFTLLSISTIKFSAIYTISWLFDSSILIPIMSSVILCGNMIWDYRAPSCYQICMRAIALVVTFVSSGIILPSFICEFSDACNNPLTRWLWIKLRDYLRSRVWKLYQYNDLNMHLIWLTVTSWLLYQWTNSAVAVFILAATPWPQISFPIAALGWFSNYLHVHLIIISLFIYLGLNIYNLQYVCERPLEVTIITDYNDKIVNPDIPIDPTAPPIIECPDDDFEILLHTDK